MLKLKRALQYFKRKRVIRDSIRVQTDMLIKTHDPRCAIGARIDYKLMHWGIIGPEDFTKKEMEFISANFGEVMFYRNLMHARGF